MSENVSKCNFSLSLFDSYDAITEYGTMTHKSGPTPQKAHKIELARCANQVKASGESVPQPSESMTIYLPLESKRKAHALALAANRSIGQVIEELIQNCPEGSK